MICCVLEEVQTKGGRWVGESGTGLVIIFCTRHCLLITHVLFGGMYRSLIFTLLAPDGQGDFTCFPYISPIQFPKVWAGDKQRRGY